jgi:hypothetical protein
MPTRHLLIVVTAVLAAASIVPAVADVPQDPVPLLRNYIRASDAELRRLERGAVLTETLESPDGREVTTFGAIRVNCTADVFAARVRNIEQFKASEYVIQIGHFQAKPALEDVATLTLDPGDQEAMRACRAGSCPLRLPAAAIDRFRTTIPWGTPAEAEAAAAAMRQFLVDEVRTYLTSGSTALPDYADRAGTIPRATAFRFLLRPSKYHAEYQPDLFQWLDQFPAASVQGGDSFLYWSRERFGLKPVISVSHSILQRRDGAVVFGSKQVFASHYFESSLGMSLYIAVPGTSHGYVTYLNRSRVDTLRGLLAPIARIVAARRARSGLERMLIDVKRKLEASNWSGGK